MLSGKISPTGPNIFAQRPAGKYFLKIEARRYGFILSRGVDAAHNKYNIKIMGENHTISDGSFLKITAANKSIYLATNHNAACYFSILERDGGFIKGEEEWVHIDRREHPDNAYLAGDIILSPATSLNELCIYLNNSKRRSNVGIGVGNFMTAQAKIFPGMRFIHLHDGREPNRSDEDWCGMKFVRTRPVEEWDSVLTHHLPRILSLDLDVFGYYADLRNRKTTAMKDRIIEIAKASDILMIFTSPGYTGISNAEQWMGEIVSLLIDDKS